MRFEIIDNDIPIIEIILGKHKIEIFSDGMKKRFLIINIRHFMEILCQNITPKLNIKDTNSRISNLPINIKMLGRFIMVIHNMCEKMIILGRIWNVFEIVGESTLVFVLIVDSAEELGVETELGEERDMGGTMPKSVDLPTNCRNKSK